MNSIISTKWGFDDLLTQTLMDDLNTMSIDIVTSAGDGTSKKYANNINEIYSQLQEYKINEANERELLRKYESLRELKDEYDMLKKLLHEFECDNKKGL